MMNTVVSEPFDPAMIDDPFAQTIEWTPLQFGGSSFVSARLQQHSSGVWFFRSAVWLLFLLALLSLL
jgi:hypothetical protein